MEIVKSRFRTLYKLSSHILHFREINFGREKSHTKHDRPAGTDSFDIGQSFQLSGLTLFYAAKGNQNQRVSTPSIPYET
jgi:hypothetical protein